MMRRALICGEVQMPDGNAQSTRLLNLGRILNGMGYAVTMLGTSFTGDAPCEGKSGEILYKNICVGKDAGRVKRRRKRVLLLKEYLESIERFDVIIISASYEDSFFRIIRSYAQKNKSLLVASVCEWYALHQYAGIVGKLYILKHRIATEIINVNIGHIIAISNFFVDYYTRRNCQCLLVPTVIDVNEYPVIRNSTNKKITIVYAGNPGKKDDLTSVIKGILKLPKYDQNRIKFDIYGVNNGFLNKKLGIDNEQISELEGCVEAHGRVPFDQVSNIISNADFTVLLRPNERYANAGYPTKVGESMAAGVPVIANITSDLGRDIIDGKTGIVVAGDTPDAFAEALKRVISLDKEQLTQMRWNCREHAEKTFDYRCYIEPMREFIESCRCDEN